MKDGQGTVFFGEPGRRTFQRLVYFGSEVSWLGGQEVESGMVKFILRVVANSISIWVASLVIDGVKLEGNFIQILLLGVVFGLVNALIKPFLKLISTPLIVLTLGLFTLIINTLLLILTEWLMSLISEPPVLQIDGFIVALLASAIISLISWLLSLLIGD